MKRLEVFIVDRIEPQGLPFNYTIRMSFDSVCVIV